MPKSPEMTRFDRVGEPYEMNTELAFGCPGGVNWDSFYIVPKSVPFHSKNEMACEQFGPFTVA